MSNIKFYNDKFISFCKQLRWSTIALADRCKVSRQCISMWKNGKAVPNETKIRLLSGIMGIKAKDISNIEENIPISEKEVAQIASIWSSMKKTDEKSRSDEFRYFINRLYVYHE